MGTVLNAGLGNPICDQVTPRIWFLHTKVLCTVHILPYLGLKPLKAILILTPRMLRVCPRWDEEAQF